MSTEKIIYWKAYSEPKKYFDPILKREMEITGEYICDDDRVERVWLTGGFHPTSLDNTHLQYFIHILFKDGERKDFKTGKLHISDDDHNLDPLISQAEQYLKSLP